MKKFKIDLTDEQFKILDSISKDVSQKAIASLIEKYCNKVVLQRDSSLTQFDKYNVNGILTRVFYYQKKAYLKDTSIQKMVSRDFVKKWKNKKKFKKIWKKYEESGFNPKLKPVFVRSIHTDKLNVGIPSDRAALNYAY